jgi:hypothetical protein
MNKPKYKLKKLLGKLIKFDSENFGVMSKSFYNALLKEDDKVSNVLDHETGILENDLHYWFSNYCTIDISPEQAFDLKAILARYNYPKYKKEEFYFKLIDWVETYAKVPATCLAKSALKMLLKDK